MSRTPMEQFGDALKENRDLCEKILRYERGLNYLADCCNGDCGLTVGACPGCYAREMLRSK